MSGGSTMSCFDDDVVLRFVAGMLSVDEVSAMDGHLDSCPTCFQRVMAAVTSSPFTPPRRPLPPADDGVAPGQLLADRYRVVRLLGAGASGRVFEAFDQLAQVEVALKVLGAGQAADPRWSSRFVRELQLARRLDHPNVCRVLDMEQAGEHRFLVMELATGALRAELASAGGLSWSQAMTSAQAIAAGLQAMHDAGILHRDVKPENVLRMRDGRLVLSDFGLATRPGTGAALTRFVGTPMYMAPELVDGESATVASDVWSLGVVIHELFFGCRPRWQQGTRGRVFQPVAAGRPALLAHRDRRVQRLCGACLSPSPHGRPRSVAEVITRLSAIARRPEPSRLIALVAGRGRLVAGLAAVLALGGLVVGGLGWWSRRASVGVASQPTSPVPRPPAPPLVLVKPDYQSATTLMRPVLGGVSAVLAPDAEIAQQALATATSAIEAGLRSIPGVVVRLATDSRTVPPPGQPTWTVQVRSAGVDRTKGHTFMHVESRLFGPDGHHFAMSNEACPVADITRCVHSRSAGVLRGLLKDYIRDHLEQERVRNDACAPKARDALARYLSDKRAGGLHPTHAPGLLGEALDADVNCFSARFEQVWTEAMRGEVAIRTAERTAFGLEVDRLRRQRPGEQGVATLHCLALTVAAVYDAPSDASIKLADTACGRAAQAEIDNRPALFALAQLAARRCDGRTAGEYLQRVLDEATGGYPVSLTPITARPVHAGSMLPALVVQTLAPDYDSSRWGGVAALMRGAALRAQDRDEFALNQFKQSISEFDDIKVWPGTTTAQVASDFVRNAAALRGLQQARQALGRTEVDHHGAEVREVEAMLAGVRLDPMALLPYLWVDPRMLQQRLRAVPVPDSCGARIQRALLFQAMGNRRARDAELAACKDDGEWLRACRAQLSGGIEPAGPEVSFAPRSDKQDGPR